ncbi:MAG TPA: hypothetical protein VM221_01565 [Armatimonadota bacterium]|nr:hypothetical protein [Armatimonadota bacterium]
MHDHERRESRCGDGGRRRSELAATFLAAVFGFTFLSFASRRLWFLAQYIAGPRPFASAALWLPAALVVVAEGVVYPVVAGAAMRALAVRRGTSAAAGAALSWWMLWLILAYYAVIVPPRGSSASSGASPTILFGVLTAMAGLIGCSALLGSRIGLRMRRSISLSMAVAIVVMQFGWIAVSVQSVHRAVALLGLGYLRVLPLAPYAIAGFIAGVAWRKAGVIGATVAALAVSMDYLGLRGASEGILAAMGPAMYRPASWLLTTAICALAGQVVAVGFRRAGRS